MIRVALTSIVLVLLSGSLVAETAAEPGYARVLKETRGGKPWLVLDSLASEVVPTPMDALIAVIERYEDYPKLFPRIRESSSRTVSGAVLLTEKVVVAALGIENVNRFTLRIVRVETTTPVRRVTFTWTQEWTDGTIDSLSGSWRLTDRSGPAGIRTEMVYHTTSAVPVVAIGQDAVVSLFLAGETKAVVRAVAKAAQSQ